MHNGQKHIHQTEVVTTTSQAPQADSTKMLEFLIYNIYVKFSIQFFSKELVFQWVQTVPHYLPTYFFPGMSWSLYEGP